MVNEAGMLLLSLECFVAAVSYCRLVEFVLTFLMPLQHILLLTDSVLSRSWTERKVAFKQAVDLEGGRRRRQEATVSIRKNKKEQSLLKRRGVTKTGDDLDAAEATATINSNSNSSSNDNHNNNDDDNNNNTGNEIRKITVDDIPRLQEVILQPGDMELLTLAVRAVRKLLSSERNPPVDQVLAAGILPRLVEFLGCEHWPMLMFETAWALTNIASTDRTCDVVNQGAILPLIRCLHYHSADVREQAAWCLGNIAGDRHEYRDMLLQNNVMASL
jgi:importin subunit alpha-6/7